MDGKDFDPRNDPVIEFDGNDSPIVDPEIFLKDQPLSSDRLVIEKRADFSIPEEDFDAFAAWYLHFTEKRELLGNTNQLLYICRKA